MSMDPNVTNELTLLHYKLCRDEGNAKSVRTLECPFNQSSHRRSVVKREITQNQLEPVLTLRAWLLQNSVSSAQHQVSPEAFINTRFGDNVVNTLPYTPH